MEWTPVKQSQSISEILRNRQRNDTGGVVDASGNHLCLHRIDGRLYTPFGEEHVRHAFTMSMRPTDVLVDGFAKTGAHWAIHFLRAIIRDELHYDRLIKAKSMMEFASKETKEALPSPRILNTHVRFDRLPQQVKEFKNKIILTRRNPKDVAVSLYNHFRTLDLLYDYKGSFNDFFELFMEGKVDYGNYFDYYNHWEEVIRQNPDHPILVVDFEDLKEDLISGLKRVCKFLDIELTESKLKDIAKVVEFQSMKKAYRDEFFVRTGEVGQWKKWLTVEQSERIDEAFKKRMAGSDYHPKYIY